MNELAVTNDLTLSKLGGVLVQSGFFADTRQASQAIVKILAGRELGFGPIASMTGIYVIGGRISVGANLIAAAIKRSGKYNFTVRKMDDAECEIEFFELFDGKWQSIGISKFTAADARRAGTKNMEKYPRNMLYARAISNGARWYTPDIFGGAVYTPEELGANVNEDGDVIDMPVEQPAAPAEKQADNKPAELPGDAAFHDAGLMPLEEAENMKNSKGERYGDLPTETLAAMANSIAKAAKKPGITDEKATEYDLKTQAIRSILASRLNKED